MLTLVVVQQSQSMSPAMVASNQKAQLALADGVLLVLTTNRTHVAALEPTPPLWMRAFVILSHLLGDTLDPCLMSRVVLLELSWRYPRSCWLKWVPSGSLLLDGWWPAIDNLFRPIVEALLVPLCTVAGLPTSTTDVAKFQPADTAVMDVSTHSVNQNKVDWNSRHVVASMIQLDDPTALTTPPSLPLRFL